MQAVRQQAREGRHCPECPPLQRPAADTATAADGWTYRLVPEAPDAPPDSSPALLPDDDSDDAPDDAPDEVSPLPLLPSD